MASKLIWIWTSKTCYLWEMATGAIRLQKHITFYILLPESMDGQRTPFQNIKTTRQRQHIARDIRQKRQSIHEKVRKDIKKNRQRIRKSAHQIKRTSSLTRPFDNNEMRNVTEQHGGQDKIREKERLHTCHATQDKRPHFPSMLCMWMSSDYWPQTIPDEAECSKGKTWYGICLLCWHDN